MGFGLKPAMKALPTTLELLAEKIPTYFSRIH
jgi:hypothetical protein